MNLTGRPDGFRPADDIMEDGIKDIKDTHAAHGPKVDWKYFETLHPVLPVIKTVTTHLETEFKAWTRYSAHTTSSDKAGIQALQSSYISEGVYQYRPGRTLLPSNKAKNFVDDGYEKLPDAIGRWVESRNYERSVDEDWPSENSDSDADMVV